MKISNRVEQIFSHAVALEQAGTFKNTIYVNRNEIYILNFDHTVLLRFKLRKSETPFQQPVSFRANDYDSKHFYEEGDQVVFEKSISGFVRKKSCGKPELSPNDIKRLFENRERKGQEFNSLILPSNLISLLDTSLSHIEFSGQKGKGLTIIQRNIYSGGILKIVPENKNKGLFELKTLKKSFGPIGLRTNDFIALFTFQDVLNFGFEENYITVSSIDKNKMDFSGFIACCLYDEIIQIKEVQNNGRQKQKIRRSK